MRHVGKSLATIALLVGVTNTSWAQCPDGTPPPCDVRRTIQVPVNRRPPPPAPSARARQFLVLPFRNVTRQADQDWLVEGSTTMLVEALGKWQGISVVPDEKLYPALKRAAIVPGSVADADKVRRVAEETGGWTAVTGEVLATGGRLRITARAWDVPTSRELVRASSEIAASGDVRVAFDSVSLRLLRTVGLDSITADLAATTTRNLDAYRAYLSGRAHMRRAEVKPALKDFQEAVRLDSSFALGWVNLAETTLAAEPGTLLNPQSATAQYIAKAVALSSQLPARERQRVLATEASFRAQFTDGRRILEGLVASDSNDVDALIGLAGLEMFDPILIEVPGGMRPRGSLNRAARLAKRAAELDPSRPNTLALLAQIYGLAGVPGSAPLFGIDRAPTSYPDMIRLVRQPGRARSFTPLFADSLILIPIESLSVIPRDSINAMQKKARTAALGWGERWVTAASGDAAPYAAMANLYAVDHDYARALKAVAIAESLGVQIPSWSGAARRMTYLGKSGNYAAASKLADSLTAAGFFANTNNVIVNIDAASWAFAMHLLTNRVAQANALMEQQIAFRRQVGPGAPPEPTSYFVLIGNTRPEDEPLMPRALRGMQLDSLLSHLGDAAATSQIGQWLPVMLPFLADVADTTGARTASLIKAADALAASGHAQLAFQLASNAVSSDSTLEASAATYAWYRAGAEPFNAVKRATMDRFKPTSATIAADRAVFEWTVADSAPFARNRSETPLMRPEYRWEITVNAGERYYRFGASGGSRVPGPPVSGTLADVLSATGSRWIFTGKLAGGVQKDTTQLQGGLPRTEVAPGVLRIIVTDKAVLDVMRTARPAEARFRFFPCVRPLGSTGSLECLDTMVKVIYP